MKTKMMKTAFWALMVATLLGTTLYSGTASAQDITWLTMEQAQAANKTAPKPFFIDVYTDWCGWCKRMDATTFKNAEVAAYISKHFYAVKFNAEQRQDVVFGGKSISNTKGTHDLAFQLLGNRLGYPSFAVLNADLTNKGVLVGYQTPEQILAQLRQLTGKQ